MRQLYAYVANEPTRRLAEDGMSMGLTNKHIDCKTVPIFAYSSTREQSNKMFGMRLKTESETGERR